MDNVDYLIIGGGVAGTSAAAAIREHDVQGSIVLVTDEQLRLYSRPRLPHFASGKIKEENLFVRKASFYEENKVDFRPESRVERFDPESRTATMSDGSRIRFHKALIATGGRPRTLDVTGSEAPGVLYFRTAADAKAVSDTVRNCTHVVVIGGGFISLEFVHVCAALGVEATVLVRDRHYWARALDQAGAQMLTGLLAEHGAIIRTNVQNEQITANGRFSRVQCTDGTSLRCDAIGVGIGIAPNIDFLAGGPIKMERGVWTDSYMRTNVPDVFAAGDIAEFEDVVLQRRHQMGNWANGEHQGRIAGLNMAGVGEEYRTVSAYTIQSFGLNISFVGDTAATQDTEIIPRGNPQERRYGRIFLRNGLVVGATLLGRGNERGIIAKMIQSRVNLQAKKDLLRQGDFDLRELVQV